MASSTTALLWFRRDLRLADLPPLADAADAADQVLAVFVLDPTLTKSSGARRLQFLHDALRALDDDLGGRLLVVRGKPENQIPRIAKAVSATSVHVSEDFLPYGRRRDEKVSDALGDTELVGHGSPYAVSPGQVTKNDGTPYKVFTPYFRAWQERGWHSPATTSAKTATWLDPDDVSGVSRASIPDEGVELILPAGEKAARKRWSEFLDEGITGYADDRDRPDLDAGSRMSSYLKYGNIHPRTLLADLAGRRGEGAKAYARELAFRDFYADVVYHWPRSTWHNWNRNFDDIPLDDGADAKKRFEAWTKGETGYPIVDAGMRQLSETGFMHNRVRMVVASFLVKDLHLPWWWGAQYFLDQLIDGDMASNQHGWQWAAGTGTDAAPYFRVFNPTTQGQRFDPQGDYVRRWVPELAEIAGKSVHDPGDDRPSDYPAPMVDHKAERREALDRYGTVSG
ncbi:cryptochrome/photolyase family protein [Williamsia sterculiae]|uniref:Deoxyribodipyrimidine photo-lyase n=1 Tax=Williamsia sterculiae TaxID=1344003 RepID=A0A1N7DEJ2_9NOCA|nr:deoxyribodipyrimidine photo-lyase [Williamsia sterculiae]SIR74279.1 deoxyribodipyrimidine photo-lyase [Williamsia sterculiae]